MVQRPTKPALRRDSERPASQLHQPHRLSEPQSFIEALSSDAGTQHGRTPVLAVCDEIHAWRSRDLWDVIKTGLVKTPGSLCITITTAGRGQEHFSWDLIEYARKVAKGQIDDPATLAILFEADPDADWKDETIWHKVNPGLAHGYPDLPALRQLAKEAEARPAEREAFKQLHLNMWAQKSHAPFVEMITYDRGKKPVNLEDLKGRPCWLGVDLSSTEDLTAIVAAWRDGDGGYIVHPWYFCPADNLERRAQYDSVPYPLWADQGFIIPTSGNVVDFDAVEAKLREICEYYPVNEIAFDPHLGRQMINALSGDGYPTVEFRQGWVSMAPAIKELERAIIAGRFQHGAHPILRWNFDNIAVQTDSAGNKCFS